MTEYTHSPQSTLWLPKDRRPVDDPTRQKDVDVADRYWSDHMVQYEPAQHRGFACIPVLEFLWGKPWNNQATNYLEALRPSSVRVTIGEVKNDVRTWRVTVEVDGDRRTIRRITQEVSVGLVGCRYGADLREHDDSGERKLDDER